MKNIIRKMQKKIKMARDRDLALWFSVAHSILSYFYSASFFEYSLDNEVAKRNKLLVTILFFVIMFFVYWGLVGVIRNRKKYRNYVKYGVIYFAFLMVVLLLVWPGIWRNDDMQTAMAAKEYVLDGWQHALTSLVYMVSFRLLPFFSGVIIVQCAIVSVITSYIYNTVLTILAIKKILFKVVLWIPFFLFPVIDSIMYPLRPILFSYALILLICLMAKCIFYKRVTTSEVVLLAMLFIVGSSWRSEGIYLVVVAMVFIWYLVRKKWLAVRTAAYATLAVVFGFLAMRWFENSALDTWHQNSYRVSGTIEIAVPLARQAYSDGENESELSAMGEIMNLEYVMQNPEMRGEAVFWSDGGMRNDYMSDEMANYLKAVVKLGLKYPDIVFKDRVREFVSTSALVDDISNVIWDTTSNYDGAQQKRIQDFIAQGGSLMHPWNVSLRKAVVRILEGRNIVDYNDTIFTYPVFWNLVVPIVSIIVFVILMFCKHRVGIGLVVFSILIKTFIVFMTAPGGYHMYYFAEYLLGYILLVIMVVRACSSWRRGGPNIRDYKTLKHRKVKRV